MQRDQRNTSKWFENEKPLIEDRAFASKLGPGKYDSIDRLTTN
jgi:hypothetical protein